MIPVIAEHIKAHRHQLGKHVLMVGSAVKVPPRDLAVADLIEEVAQTWAGEQVAALEGRERVARALELFAEGVPDHAERARLLREALGPEARPAEGHVRLSRLIKDGYYSVVFLSEPDNMLERALHAQHMEPEKDYHLLVAGVDEPAHIKIALAESTRVALVKCGGDLDARFLPCSPAEMTAVAAQMGDLLNESFKVFSVFVAMADRDDPFLSYIPREGARVFWINTLIPMADPELYDELKLENPASADFHRLQPHVTQLLEARHSSRHLLCREPGSFNEFFAKLHTRLIRQHHRARGKRRDLTVLRGGPYRFLKYFDVEDVDFYFGREDDVKAVLEKIEHHPLTVVFGRSAIGKTSLLRAGIMAALRRETEEADKEHADPWLVAYARLTDDPVAAMRDSIVAALDAAGYPSGEVAGHESLSQVILSAAALTGRKVIVLLDQFAEFFVKLGDKVRDSYRQVLRECVQEAGDRFRLVIAVREDFLGEMFELRTDFPEIMQNMHRLHPLTREQAEDAILKPAQNFELQVERGLVRRLVEDLYRDGVEPVKLQVVCHSLYEGRSRGSYVITEAIYERLGGAETILDKYLERSLSPLPPAEKRVAQKVLTFVAGGSELKAAQTVERIVTGVGGERELVDRVLTRLVDVGLLCPVGKGRLREFELVHEILADKIQAELAGSQTMLRDVQDLVTREMSNFTQFGLPIGADDLKLIAGSKEDLSLGPEELKLIVRSALTAEVEADYWFGRVSELGEAKLDFVASLMRDEALPVRLHAYRGLKEHLEPLLIRHIVHGIDDESSEIRGLAKTYLAALERPLGVMLEHQDARVRALGARALGYLASRRYVRALTEAFVEGFPSLRDEITNALLDIDDPRAPDLLLRAVSGATESAWAKAYALGRLSVGEEELKALGRAASARRKPELDYARGIALTHRRNYAEAAEAFARSRAVANDERVPPAVAEAEAELEEQRARSVSGANAWCLFGRIPAHGAATSEEVLPPLEPAWKFETKDHVVASPVIRDNTAFIGSRDKHFYAVDTGKGTARWSFEASERIEGAAALSRDLVFFASLNGVVYALDVGTGAERWQTSLNAIVRCDCTLDDDSLYLGTRAGDLLCLAAPSGETVWRRRLPGEISATPALDDGLVVAGCWDGHLYALRARDGAPVWEARTQAPVSASPSIAEGVVYCGSDDKGLYALNLHTGRELWRAGIGGQVRSSAALSESLAVVGCVDGNCYAVSRETGRVQWAAPTQEEILASPAISGNVVYVGSRDGSLYAFSLSDGELLWRYQAAYGVYSSPAVAEQTVFVGFDYYHLAAFRPGARAPKKR